MRPARDELLTEKYRFSITCYRPPVSAFYSLGLTRLQFMRLFFLQSVFLLQQCVRTYVRVICSQSTFNIGGLDHFSDKYLHSNPIVLIYGLTIKLSQSLRKVTKFRHRHCCSQIRGVENHNPVTPHKHSLCNESSNFREDTKLRINRYVLRCPC